MFNIWEMHDHLGDLENQVIFALVDDIFEIIKIYTEWLRSST